MSGSFHSLHSLPDDQQQPLDHDLHGISFPILIVLGICLIFLIVVPNLGLFERNTIHYDDDKEE